MVKTAWLPDRMRALRIHETGSLQNNPEPLREDELPLPILASGQVLIRVIACGVCRTELDEIEGRTPPARLPMIPGHQVVGEVVKQHDACSLGLMGATVGVAWIYGSCGDCFYCRSGSENLCPQFRACGRDAPGGYAQYMAADEHFVYPLPAQLEPLAAAPLLCAGAVGLRAIRLCGLSDGQAVGLTGFGASGHLVLKMLRILYPDSGIYVFARNPGERTFALDLGADWAGDTTDNPPTAPAAIIDTTPAWKPVIAALGALAPGGRLVINAISKESGDIQEWLSLDYPRHLWQEKVLRSVTNVTREDVRDCLSLAATHALKPEITVYPLEQANRALREIRAGGIRGARVLSIG